MINISLLRSQKVQLFVLATIELFFPLTINQLWRPGKAFADGLRKLPTGFSLSCTTAKGDRPSPF